MCTSEEEGFQHSVHERLFVGVHVWSSRVLRGGRGMQCSEGGVDINHQEEHGSVASGGD